MARNIHPQTSFRRAIEATDAPVYLLNRDSVILYANPGVARWLRVEPGELAGRRCVFDSASPPLSETPDLAGLCPPPSVLEGPALYGSIHADREGRREWRRAWFQPLGDVDRNGAAVLVVASRQTFDRPPGECPLELKVHEWLTHIRQQASPLYSLDSLVGTSPHAIQLKRQVQAAITSGADVVIHGPAGSGREHVARVISEERNPNAAPLVVHCAIADSEMIQQQIRQWVLEPGHRDGSDVLLLVDVDRLSLLGQNELWGFSQLPDFCLHTIATSSQDLLALAAAGRFHSGLAHYLATLTIPMASLADRLEDLPYLAQTILERCNRESLSVESDDPAPRQKTGFRQTAMDCLVQYAWPGNLDQLDQVVRSAWERAAGGWIELDDLPDLIRLAQQADQVGAHQSISIDLAQFLESIESELILRALHQSRNNRSLAAKRLNISRGRLLRRIAHFNLSVESESVAKTPIGKGVSPPATEETEQPIFEPADGESTRPPEADE